MFAEHPIHFHSVELGNAYRKLVQEDKLKPVIAATNQMLYAYVAYELFSGSSKYSIRDMTFRLHRRRER